MATTTFTGDGLLDFYGTNAVEECVSFNNGAFASQLVGLVPCMLDDTTNCSTDCFTVPVFSGDNNSFLFNFNPSIIATDFRLFKQDSNNDFVQVALLSANEGEAFDLGFSTNYPGYAGFRLDWEKIYNNPSLGAGVYKFVVFNIDLNQSLQSYPFDLKDDTCENKDGTSYLEVTNKGIFNNWKYTKDNEGIRVFDLESLEWLDSCRYFGKVVNTELEQNIEYNKFATSREEIIYNDGVQNYDLNVFKCDYELFKRILHYLKGKDIKLTNDNIDREYNLYKQNVVLTGESTSSKYPKNKTLYQVQIKFKDEYADRYKVCD
jgi:hypothetical protein